MLSRLLALLRTEPAAIFYAIAGAVGPAAAFLLHWDHTKTAAATTIATALAVILTAVKTRPVGVQAIMGALATIIGASAAFGLHLQPGIVATGMAAVNLILGWFTRSAVTPVSVIKAKARAAAGQRSRIPEPGTPGGRNF